MIYKDNEQLVNEIKKIMIDNDIKQCDLADNLGISKQALNKIFNKKNLNCNDMKKLLDQMGYNLIIDFQKKD